MNNLFVSGNFVYGSSWNGYPIQDQYSPFVESYLFRIFATIENSIRYYKKLFVVRFDLRVPEGFDEIDTAVISRFMESLHSQVREDYLRHVNHGQYPPGCKVRFVWAKERGYSGEGLHYHVCLFLNHKRYWALGSYIYGNHLDTSESQRNMAYRIAKAWISATRGMARPSDVHFAQNGGYVLDRNATNFIQVKKDLFFRLSYLAKVATKENVIGRRFGSSRT